jgi:hypothetical protein
VRYFKCWLFDLGLVLLAAGTLLAWNVLLAAWLMLSVIVNGGYASIEVPPIILTGIILLIISGMGALLLGMNRVRRTRHSGQE